MVQIKWLLCLVELLHYHKIILIYAAYKCCTLSSIYTEMETSCSELRSPLRILIRCMENRRVMMLQQELV